MADTVIHLGDFGVTVTVAVTAASATFTPVAPASKFLVVADVDICLRRNADATTADFRLNTGERACVNVRSFDGETLSFICADGEPDGNISLTQVT